MQHLWTPPSGQGKTSGIAVTRSRMLPSVRPLVRPWSRGPAWEFAERGQITVRTRGTVLKPGCPDPVSPTVAPYSPSARPTPRRPRRAHAARAGALYVPPLTSRAQTMRAVLLARATVTSMRGLRASIRASQEPSAAPRRPAAPPRWRRDQQAADGPLAHLRDGPELLLAPGRFCSGVSPSQAAKSRPARKASAAGASATMAAAVIGPMPGMVISRRAIGSALARRAISPSRCAICVPSTSSGADEYLAGSRARSPAAEDAGSSIWATRRVDVAGPWARPGRTPPGARAGR